MNGPQGLLVTPAPARKPHIFFRTRICAGVHLIGYKFGSRGPSTIEKISHTEAKLLVTRFSPKNVVSVSVTVSAKGIGQFGFQFRYWT